MNLQIGEPTGLNEVVARLENLAQGLEGIVSESAAQYLVGDDSHGLRSYPGYKYATRLAAYGVSFFSDKQRRWFWANGGPDMIGNHRNFSIREGWHIDGKGASIFIRNQAQGVGYVMGANYVANQPFLAGWRSSMDNVRANIAGAIRAAMLAVADFIYSRQSK